MHTATDTSIEAYHLKAAKINESQRVVFKVICAHWPISNAGILDILQREQPYMHYQINMITGRTFELRNMGMVEDAGYIRDDRSGCRVHLWRPTLEYREVQGKLL